MWRQQYCAATCRRSRRRVGQPRNRPEREARRAPDNFKTPIPSIRIESMYIYIYIYVYMYIYREREIHTCIHVHTYMYVYTFVYIDFWDDWKDGRKRQLQLYIAGSESGSWSITEGSQRSVLTAAAASALVIVVIMIIIVVVVIMIIIVKRDRWASSHLRGTTTRLSAVPERWRKRRQDDSGVLAWKGPAHRTPLSRHSSVPASATRSGPEYEGT